MINIVPLCCLLSAEEELSVPNALGGSLAEDAMEPWRLSAYGDGLAENESVSGMFRGYFGHKPLRDGRYGPGNGTIGSGRSVFFLYKSTISSHTF